MGLNQNICDDCQGTIYWDSVNQVWRHGDGSRVYEQDMTGDFRHEEEN